MGHSAFLRWSALQHQSWGNEGGKIFSEEHVSEDFVLVSASKLTTWPCLVESAGVELTLHSTGPQPSSYGLHHSLGHLLELWIPRGSLAFLRR
jgi:hypothetical protein